MKNYIFNKQSIIFRKITCQTTYDILKSPAFLEVLSNYYQESHNLLLHTEIMRDYRPQDIIDVYIKIINEEADASKLKDRSKIYRLTQGLYDYWRRLYRFATIDNLPNATALINVSNNLNDLILILYRTVTQKLFGKKHTVYRQLSAGVNAIVGLIENKWNKQHYAFLGNVRFAKVILFRPPFIVRSKSNTRIDFFEETKQNFLKTLKLESHKFYAIPIKVGRYMAYVYCHSDYFYQAISLVNLFEPAYNYEFLNAKPDFVLFFGVKSEVDGKIFHDKNTDILFGIVNDATKNDYFGYLKKMLLTLHNLKEINSGGLPIHGAMVSLTFNNSRYKNVVFIGDSGAGKSETIEALKKIGKSQIKNITTIFDDMGTFHIKKNHVVASGTEIGAFVRLDDLEADYAYQEIDRAIFVNPNKSNARVIIPISDYEYISKNHRIDMVLYANNYDDGSIDLKIISDLNQLKTIFLKGERKAKGTTNEVGMTATFFANPFGPMQKQEKTLKIFNKVFNCLNKDKVPMGEIYTRLATDAHKSKGPLIAAQALLDYFKKTS